MNTRVIVIANQKGGVGKTTNTIHLARALAEVGKKCLIIDLDSSAGATTTLGVPTVLLKSPHHISLLSVIYSFNALVRKYVTTHLRMNVRKYLARSSFILVS